MRERWKRYIEIGILVVMTAWITKTGIEREIDPQQDLQPGQYLQSEEDLRSEQIPQSGQSSRPDQELQSELENAGQNLKSEAQNNISAAVLDGDTDLYAQCLRNLHQGNNMVYTDGYYYFRSQAQNYSLCRTEGIGMPVEVVADQIPGAIYIREDQVYFINVSDSRTLYCVGTDGSGLRQVSDFSMQELVVVDDRIYFRSVYDREYDPFYQLTEEDAADDRYLYSMKLDGSDCRLLIPQVCQEFTTDGMQLYYVVYDGKHDATLQYALYKCNFDGTEEEMICYCEYIWDLLPWQGHLYWVDSGKKQLMRLNGQGEKEALASNAWRFTISDGQAYVINGEQIRKIDLTTGEDRLLVRREDVSGNSGQEKEDKEPWYHGGYNRGMFLVNGQLFVKYFESEDKGVLWHIWDEREHGFIIFEDMEPLAAETLVSDTSWSPEHGELLFYYPGREDGGTEKYLDADGELCYEESYGTMKDGSTYGDFHIALPRFNSALSSYVQLNQQMEGLIELAMEDKDDFFQEIEEVEDPEEHCYMWNRYHGYYNCYIDEKYVSMYYYRGGYEGGMRDWRQSLPLIFDRETGVLLHMDDLFTVERKFYMKRLTGAIYKCFEMEGIYEWNEAFDNNVLTKMLGDLRCYLTPDGIVLCYERYEIAAGAGGSPTFEIPYEWFEDIFRQ